MFSDILSLEHKNKEVEMVNFNHYKNTTKNSYCGGNGANVSDKQGRLKHCFKCNSVKHFACDCTGLRNNIDNKILHCFKCNSAQHFPCDFTGLKNNINTIMESDQVHFILFNGYTCYQNIINDSNIKNV